MNRLFVVPVALLALVASAHAAPCPPNGQPCINTITTDGNGNVIDPRTVTPSNTQPIDPALQPGTITLGGAAQTLFSAGAVVHGCKVQNQSAGDLWINDLGLPAVASQPSIWLPPGALFECDAGGASLLAYSIYGATTGQAFMKRAW